MHDDFKQGGEDLGRVSVIAFKRLWNRNNPEKQKQLPLTQTFDAATELKLRSAPANGFAIGARCDAP